jgi:hypothetical protein
VEKLTSRSADSRAGCAPPARFGNKRASSRVFLARGHRRPLQRPPEEFEDEFEERLLEEFDELLLELLLEEFDELFPAEWRSGSACCWTNWSGVGVSGRASAGSGARAITAAADKVDIVSLFIEILRRWNRRAGRSPARSKRNLGTNILSPPGVVIVISVPEFDCLGAAIRCRRLARKRDADSRVRRRANGHRSACGRDAADRQLSRTLAGITIIRTCASQVDQSPTEHGISPRSAKVFCLAGKPVHGCPRR